MSGNEPTWSEDAEPEAAGGLYGAPKGTNRPGDEADGGAPQGFVAPLSLDDDPADDAPTSDTTDPGYGHGSGPDVVALDLGDDEDQPPAPPAAPARGSFAVAGEEASEPRLGNRPAEGARVVSASEIFSEAFLGAEGASDFLGLDTEFDPTPMAKNAGGLQFAYHDPGAALATEEDAGQGYGAPRISPPDQDPGYLEPAYADDDYAGDLDDGGDGGFGAEELHEDTFGSRPRRARKRGLFVGAGAFALGLAVVGAVLYGPGLGGGSTDPVEVASSRTPTPRTATPVTAPVDANPLEQAAEVPAASAQPRRLEDWLDGDSSAATDEETGLEDVFLTEEAEWVELVDVVEQAADDVRGGDSLDEVEPVGKPALAREPSGSGASLADLLAEHAVPGNFYGKNADQLDLVWRGETVPFEAIFAGSRILTPAVGPVRIHMATTDVFEGRLFAVGEKKVWVDMELGRIGLDGNSVARIERLPRGVDPTKLDTETLALGHRVRAQVPGGVIYGRVRSVLGTSVTLVTDSGARITLDDPVLEPVGDRKSVVLKL